MDTTEQGSRIVITLEPSKRLSEILGFPYYIEKLVDIKDLRLTESEKKRLKAGEEIQKWIPVSNT